MQAQLKTMLVPNIVTTVSYIYTLHLVNFGDQAGLALQARRLIVEVPHCAFPRAAAYAC